MMSAYVLLKEVCQLLVTPCSSIHRAIRYGTCNNSAQASVCGGDGNARRFSNTQRYIRHSYYHNKIGNILPACKVSGTPADCVRIALNVSLFGDDWKPHLVLSGINRGHNSGMSAAHHQKATVHNFFFRITCIVFGYRCCCHGGSCLWVCAI